jgi:hypothetical protein
MLEVGKLYSCKRYYLLLYPDREAAASRAAALGLEAAVATTTAAASSAAYWSKEFGKPVSHCNLETPLLVLSADNEYVEVLVGDRKAWIINQEWLKIEEIPCP